MTENFKTEIISPEKIIFSDDVSLVTLSSYEGDMSILRNHISIIDPKILILMGSTAMESLFSSNIKISRERGKWKDIIINNKTYLCMITFHPAYLLRQPENKKFSWKDLKEIRKKIDQLNIML